MGGGGSYIAKWQGCASYLLRFEIPIFRFQFFVASSFKHMVVSFRVPNFHNFIEI